MGKKLIALALFSVVVTSSALELRAQQIHALVISDQSPSAGWGQHLPNITFDVLTLFATLHNQVPTSQLDYYSLPISNDQDANPRYILEHLNAMNPAANDTLLVYFTGHGASDDQGHYLQLAQGKLYRQELKRAMERKGARLNVLLTDCCNVRGDGKIFMAPAPRLEPPQTVTPLFDSLFFDQRGWVDVNGSSPGQGAFFTANFQESGEFPGSLFTKELGKFWDLHQQHALSWDRLVRDVSLGVAVAFKSQYPKGATVAKGFPVQTEQTVYAIEYPLMPPNKGPRTGLTIRDYATGGVVILNVRDGYPGERVYDLDVRSYRSLKSQQVITRCNGVAVRDAMHFVQLAQNSPRIMRLTVRDGAQEHEYLMHLKY